MARQHGDAAGRSLIGVASGLASAAALALVLDGRGRVHPFLVAVLVASAGIAGALLAARRVRHTLHPARPDGVRARRSP
jgi:hypothetical protein